MLTLALLGCAAPFDAEPSPEPSTSAPDPSAKPVWNPVYERYKWFAGLEEWVLIHKSSSSYHCVRADGRIQRCPDVEREDEAEYYRKWGRLTMAMVERLEATPDDQEVEALVFYEVSYPVGLHDRDPALVKRAREELSREIVMMGAFWQEWVVDVGGTIPLPANRTMPMFGMKARPSVYRILSRSPGIVWINPHSRGQVGHF